MGGVIDRPANHARFDVHAPRIPIDLRHGVHARKVENDSRSDGATGHSASRSARNYGVAGDRRPLYEGADIGCIYRDRYRLGNLTRDARSFRVNGACEIVIPKNSAEAFRF
jgi:hypothetical protein